MLISTIICSHSPDKHSNLVEAVNSLLQQSHRENEVIIVIDGSDELYRKVIADYGAHDNLKAVLIKQNVGISAARNIGVKESSGDIIAFTDDDAIADSKWLETLQDTYSEWDAIAVGGRILPIWECGQPHYLPEELYWLVGVTHKGFSAEKVGEVRNTFGPNMSFKRQVFDQVGGFNENLGFSKRGESYIQAEEPEFALRMKQVLGKGVIYNPHAIVYHKVTKSKLGAIALIRRAFYQGYSKALLRALDISKVAIHTERSYLRGLLSRGIPQRVKKCYRYTELAQLTILVVVVFSIGLGFSYGYIRERIAGEKKS